MNLLPDFLSHYYEAASGPFRSLTDLPLEKAETIQENIRQAGNRFASKRAADYLSIRSDLEEQIRALFISRGGKPDRLRPHYLILGDCPWLLTWYVSGRQLRIPLAAFPADMVSFTYGDSFPAMRYQDGRPYRGQVYTLSELPDLVATYGLPQMWNAEGKLGPERYIEAQVWNDAPIHCCLAKQKPQDPPLKA
jgi:hypothetical protein